MNRLYLAILLCCCIGASDAQTPVVATGGVVNAASNAPMVAPGSLVSIFGSQLASDMASADTIPLSNTLSNVSVTFNTVPAPMLFVSQGQINAQMPWGVLSSGGSGVVNAVVTRDGVSSAPQAVQIAPISPGVFASSQNGQSLGIAVNFNDNTLAWPSGSVPGAHPAKAGDVVTIYATGLGAVDSPIQDGHNSLDKLRLTTNPPTVLIGGIGAKVLGAALSPQFVGVYQVNIQLPQGVPTGNSVSLQIQIGGVTSTDKIVMAIGQ